MEADRKILIIDDEKGIAHLLEIIVTGMGYIPVVCYDGTSGLKNALSDSQIQMVISDVRLPGVNGLEIVETLSVQKPQLPIIMMSAYGTIDMAVDAMKKGAYHFLSKPFKKEMIVHTINNVASHLELREENQRLREQLNTDFITGNTPEMLEIIQTVKKIAPFRTNVLITGESGTGKEMIARMIHGESNFSGPFIPVNCSSIPPDLMESELFGHLKGSFTGAHVDRTGLFAEADGGTLFLDEIGELDLSLQVKLLRMIQEGTIRVVGANRETPVSVRIIAATSRDLSHEMKKGNFREDLFFRLNVVPVIMPPLRERTPDIHMLAEFFLIRYAKRFGIKKKILSEEALLLMEDYDWPGNIRELENLMERMSLICEGDLIGTDEISLTSNSGQSIEDEADIFSIKKSVRILEKKLISRALEETHGRKGEAAKLLEISSRALLYKLKEYNMMD
ncbi:MAG: sigma-54-dependent Fis family transcriptional regulator [Deltaproteobacteria bacterium]|nr:sigma-54-dependent Fis family transcriptional regulator [Deltaproteobacteria bacterium]